MPKTVNLLAVFGGLALFLATIGIYGVMAYSVVQRTREIGIRMALGAQTADVLSLVIRQGVYLLLIGLAFGLTAALIVSRFISALLYEVSTSDPLTFVEVALILALVAALASYLPARKAARVDPMTALRHE
jgi:putative ABC transport system permease protein